MDMQSQIRILVGRRMHAIAARSNDSRSLQIFHDKSQLQGRRVFD